MTSTTAVFTPAELAYLADQPLGRLGTVGPQGDPQVRPVGFFVDAETGTIDVGGHRMTATQKFRNVAAGGRVSLVVDDLASRNPWTPRALEVRGTAEALPDADPPMPGFGRGVIRIHPRRILAYGIEEGGPGTRSVMG